MQENVLTKRSGISVIKPVNQMAVMPFYDQTIDLEMMAVLRSMQSPMDERRRVQERVINKHRYDSERQYWMEKGAMETNTEHRRLRKAMSMNDIAGYGRAPKTYLEIHQQHMDAAKSESVPNSRSNSSQDAYHFRYYQRGNNNSRQAISYSGSQPSSRLSIATLDSLKRETPSHGGNRYDSNQIVRSENMYPANNVARNRFNSHGPINENIFENHNFQEQPPPLPPRAKDNSVSRYEKYDARNVSMPLPNIKPPPNGEQIVVTMSRGQPDRVSISMGPSLPTTYNPSQTAKPVVSPNLNGFSKVQYHSSGSNNSSSGNNVIRQEEVSALKPSPPNNNFKNMPAGNIDKNQYNATRMERSAKRNNNVKSDSVDKTEKSASSRRISQTEKSASSSRSNQPDWYSRADAVSGTRNKPPEVERKGHTNIVPLEGERKFSVKPTEGERKVSVKPTEVERKSSTKAISDVKPETGKVVAQNPSSSSRAPNLPPHQDQFRGQRKNLKYQKPRQSSIKKSNSFKVVARSTNFFGFVSVADMKAKKKVTFSNEESERPGTA